MAASNGNHPASHLGRQMKRDRIAHGWSIRELASRTGFNNGTLSQTETGKRLMTERLAMACDRVFGKDWYVQEYDQTKHFIPPALRSWAEYEDRAKRLRVWSPGVVDGLIQTADYARVYLSTLAGVPEAVIETRLANRMARQQRVLHRDPPPAVWFVVDHAALYRLTGSPAIMAGQMRHLLEVARLPHVTMQVLPAEAHPATASGLIIADDNAAYAEHLLAGGVYTSEASIATSERILTKLLSEAYRASESAAIIGKAEEVWTGESRATAGRTAGTA